MRNVPFAGSRKGAVEELLGRLGRLRELLRLVAEWDSTNRSWEPPTGHLEKQGRNLPAPQRLMYRTKAEEEHRRPWCRPLHGQEDLEQVEPGTEVGDAGMAPHHC